MGSKRIPAAVLARAKQVAKVHQKVPRPRPPPNATREKLISALKRLHPMD